MKSEDSFAGHLPRTRSYRRLIAGLFFAGVATFAQLYALQAVLPQLSVDRAVPAATAALTVSAATLGIAVAVIPWSLVADRIGRIPAMAIGIIAATVFGFAAPLSTEISVLLLLRLGEGLALGAVPAVALAYLSEEVHVRQIAAAAGSYTAGTTVGGLAGRLVAAPIGEALDWRVGAWVVTVLCSIAAVLFLWLVPRARGFAARLSSGRTRSPRAGHPCSPIRRAGRKRPRCTTSRTTSDRVCSDGRWAWSSAGSGGNGSSPRSSSWAHSRR